MHRCSTDRHCFQRGEEGEEEDLRHQYVHREWYGECSSQPFQPGRAYIRLGDGGGIRERAMSGGSDTSDSINLGSACCDAIPCPV